MRLKFATSLAVIIALLIPISTYAAGPKPGAKCTKAGLSQISNGKKYTCIKSGKSYVWNKGVDVPNLKLTPSSTPKTSEISESNIIKAGDQCTSADRGAIKSTSAGNFTCKHDGIGAYRWFMAEASTNPNPTPSATPSPTIENIDWGLTFNTDYGYKIPYANPCQKDPFIQTQWKQLQEAYFKVANCIWPTAIGKYVLGNQQPLTKISIDLKAPIEQCKISEPSNSRALRGFYSEFDPGAKKWVGERALPWQKMIIQVIPIYAEDTEKPINSPEFDYSKFTNFIKEWIEFSSDQGATVTVRFPKEYIKINGKVGDYQLYHENRAESPSHQKFNREVTAQVDPYIDFTGANVAIFVTPAGTSFSVFQQGTIGELNTNEGKVVISTSEFPYTLDNIGSAKFKNLSLPYWWLHELFHSSIGFTDHYGDDQRNVNTEYGLGWWTLMTPGGGDLSGWEKWVLGYYGDEQINCVSANSTSTTWIVPSSVKSSKTKLTVVPISKYKGIVIESIRPSGLYYKLPKNSLGVLVYEVDLTVTMGDAGLKLVLPTNRNPNQGPYFLAEATLRQGESVLSNGHRITVVESGNFGDVVKVEKA